MASPSLRDLLNKSKSTEQNGGSTNAKSVLQSSPVQGKAEVPAEATRTEGKIPERIQPIAGNSEASKPEGTENNRLLEQAGPANPPPGLSGLALIKWRREHAAINSNTTNLPKKETVQPTTQQIISEQAPGSLVEKLTPNTEANLEARFAAASTTVAASKDTDAANDGIVKLDQLKKNLAYLANNMEQKELVAQIVRTIAVQLKNSPELTPHMANSEVDLFIRGVRQAYNIAARKKSEARDAKTSKSKGANELEGLLKGAGLDALSSLNFKL